MHCLKSFHLFLCPFFVKLSDLSNQGSVKKSRKLAHCIIKELNCLKRRLRKNEWVLYNALCKLFVHCTHPFINVVDSLTLLSATFILVCGLCTLSLIKKRCDKTFARFQDLLSHFIVYNHWHKDLLWINKYSGAMF